MHTGLTKLRSLKMDSCKALHPKGSDHFRFLPNMPGLTELSWAAHAGKPDWIEPDASVAGAEIGAMCLLMHAHKLTNLQRCVSTRGASAVISFPSASASGQLMLDNMSLYRVLWCHAMPHLLFSRASPFSKAQCSSGLTPLQRGR